MDFVNATNMQAGYTLGIAPTGQESIVVIVKATFSIPEPDQIPKLLNEQFPIIESDLFVGEPGLSSPLYESDYAPVKQKCDVLFNGSAYSPDGEPVTSVQVSLQVGEMIKEFNVIGDRVWEKDMIGIRASQATPFMKKKICYDIAFGGTDSSHDDPSKHEAYRENPVGVGFFKNLSGNVIEGASLPNTEEIGKPIEKPNGKYTPKSYGVIGRSFHARASLAGTYDDDWIENTFPFLPNDFDENYYQAAPIDQQVPFLQGGEMVHLVNLSKNGYVKFAIPEVAMPILFIKNDDSEIEVNAQADTLIIEPDNQRFIILWRSSLELKKDIFEVIQIIVGNKSKGWYRARMSGKTYYSSINDLVNYSSED